MNDHETSRLHAAQLLADLIDAATPGDGSATSTQCAIAVIDAIADYSRAQLPCTRINEAGEPVQSKFHAQRIRPGPEPPSDP